MNNRNKLLALAILLIIFLSWNFLSGSIDDNGAPSDLLLFFGRFHPLVVHLPIGFLIIAFIMEFTSRFQGFKHLRQSVPFVLLLGAIGVILSALLGYFLSLAGGYEEETLFWHKWLGLFTGILAFAAYMVKVKFSQKKVYRAYIPLFTSSILLLLITGHKGGDLTHGSDYLTHYMPATLRTAAGLPPKEKKQKVVITDLNEAHVFNHIIHPILEEKCISCHNPKKLKGELRLDTQEGILKGGEEGEIILSGNALDSRMYHLITLPATDEDRMPPRGKKPLTDDEIALIGWWIETGAPFDKKVAELAVNDDIKPALERLVEGEKDTFYSKNIPPPDPEVINQLKKSGVAVMPIGQGVNYLNVSFINKSDSLTVNDLSLLAPVKEQITWLDFRNKQSFNDEMVGHISELPNLKKLHLQNTGITDAGLSKLEKLDELEYLNLYGTAISDESIGTLSRFKKIKNLYIWQTGISQEGVMKLKERKPGLEINTGHSLKIDSIPVKQGKVE